jgi:hypothetical protein
MSTLSLLTPATPFSLVSDCLTVEVHRYKRLTLVKWQHESEGPEICHYIYSDKR